MTMHLEGPWLTTNGKFKSKRRKWLSAEQKRQHEALEAEWQQRQQEWKKLAPKFGTTKTQAVASITQPQRPRLQPPPGRETVQIPSLNNGIDSAPALKNKDKVYTGDKILGIGTMHKSNAVPIFSDTEAKDISSMRR